VLRKASSRCDDPVDGKGGMDRPYDLAMPSMLSTRRANENIGLTSEPLYETVTGEDDEGHTVATASCRGREAATSSREALLELRFPPASPKGACGRPGHHRARESPERYESGD
jgi:hypothetical protein